MESSLAQVSIPAEAKETKSGGNQVKKIHITLLALLLAAILVPAVVACGGEETETLPPAGYDINTIVAGIEVNTEIQAMLPDSIQTSGVVKVASDIPWPPWEMFVSEGSDEITGFDYDLGLALGAVLGVDFQFVQTPFDGIIPSLESGKNDIIMSAMYDNLSRREVVDFVDYAYDGTSMLVMAGNPEGITDLESLAGKTVGCEIGTTQAVLLENTNEQLQTAGKAEMDIQEYDTGPEAILALQSGRVVAYLADHSTAMYTAQTEQGGSLFDVITDPANPHGYNPQIDGIGVLKGNDQVLDAIQKALQALIDDGVYTQIIDYYGLLPVDSAQVNQGTDPGE
jgi:polar amino acid transport system substrate-binding protein